MPADSDVVTTTDAVLTQGQIIGVLQEHARPGDVIIAAAGGPPGDLQKVWDATGGRTCHLEFGFSCMGYEIPAAIGVRLAHPDPDARITAFLGDGTFLMAPTELVTAAQEGLPITLVIPENHGYQVIHRLQMGRNGREFGNEFRYRTTAAAARRRHRGRGQGRPPGRRLPAGRPGAGRRRARRPCGPRQHRRRAPRRPGRDPRPPGHRRHRGPRHPARRPARGGCVVGRRTGRGVRDRHRAAAARRVRGRTARPSGGSDEPHAHRPAQRRRPGRGRPRRASHSLGTFIGMAIPVTAEVCAAAGFDWVLLDLEHGAGGEEQVRDVVPAAGSYGVPTVVRVETAERIRIGRVAGPRSRRHHAAPARTAPRRCRPR